jgi:hypothetical protein
MRIIRIACCCLLVTLSHALYAQTKNISNANRSPRGFVQRFYDWYVPKAVEHSSAPAWNVALQAKGSSFSPELRVKLRKDSAAQARAEGEIVGLDFDPFLNGQDPDPHYQVKKIRRRGERYRVSIDSSSTANSSNNPSVIAEVMQQRGQWRFVNFRYANGRDLLSILKALNSSREAHGLPQ